jgi:acetate kinase
MIACLPSAQTSRMSGVSASARKPDSCSSVLASSRSVSRVLEQPQDESFDTLATDVEAQALETLIAGLGDLDAVGHRVVHGGERFHCPALIDDEVVQARRELSDLAPLHQAKSLGALDAVNRALPHVPAVACFDTAFHATLPAAAFTYPLPADWRGRWGLRRYGFHGLSHAYASRRAAELLGNDSARMVTCHLGAGASLAAVRDGHSSRGRPANRSPPGVCTPDGAAVRRSCAGAVTRRAARGRAHGRSHP